MDSTVTTNKAISAAAHLRETDAALARAIAASEHARAARGGKSRAALLMTVREQAQACAMALSRAETTRRDYWRARLQDEIDGLRDLLVGALTSARAAGEGCSDVRAIVGKFCEDAEPASTVAGAVSVAPLVSDALALLARLEAEAPPPDTAAA